jgi:hypothetical protein
MPLATQVLLLSTFYPALVSERLFLCKFRVQSLYPPDPPIHVPFSHSPQSLPLKHHSIAPPSLFVRRHGIPTPRRYLPQVFTPQDAQSSLDRRHKTKRFDFSLPHLRRSTNLPFLTGIDSSSILRSAHDLFFCTTLKAASTPSAGSARTNPARSSPPVSLPVFRKFNVSQERC